MNIPAILATFRNLRILVKQEVRAAQNLVGRGGPHQPRSPGARGAYYP